MFSTRLTSSTRFTGLERKSSVPASTARSMSPSSPSAVTIKIMIGLVAASDFSRWQTSKPESFGIITSSSSTSGLNAATLSSVSAPSTAVAISHVTSERYTSSNSRLGSLSSAINTRGMRGWEAALDVGMETYPGERGRRTGTRVRATRIPTGSSRSPCRRETCERPG